MFKKDSEKPFQKKLTNSQRKELKRDQLGPLARKAAIAEEKRNLENFNRFNQNFVEAYTADRNMKLLPSREAKASK